jgi:PKD repeat protein
LLLSTLIFAATSVSAAEWVFIQYANNWSSFPTYGGAEAADDFTLHATIEKIHVTGYLSGPALTTSFQGVHIVFYNNANGAPGAVAAEYTVSAGDPRIVFYTNGYANFDVTLPTPFAAAGTYFLSVQILGDYWSWGSAPASGYSAYARPAGGAWLANGSGLAFALFGTVSGPGQITGLSTTSAPNSGYFEIYGTNFGSDGRVLVNGISAPVSTWGSTSVVAYVPELVAAGTAQVQVDNGTGLSNSFPITVTTRSSSGRIRWSLRMNAPYAAGDPAVAPDGTIYVLDIFGRLYALGADGGLKWIGRGAGNRGPSLGPDGTIYVADESAVRAYQTNGSLKWAYIQPLHAFFLFDVAVGPDGNIYAVATEGIGTFSLTPAGALRWAVPEPYSRPIIDRGDIVFGPNGSNQQMYFYTNSRSHVFDLAGNLLGMTIPSRQPRVSALDGSVHAGYQAYTPNGTLIWNSPELYLANAWGLGPDGVHYGVDGQMTVLWAISPDGTAAWSLPFTMGEYYGFLGVNQQNSVIVLYGTGPGGTFLNAVGVANRREIWRISVPLDPDTAASQFVMTNPVFSSDGSTSYVTTTVSGIDRAFVYAIDTTDGTVANQPPVARATATPSSGPVPLAVSLSGASSSDPDGTIVSYSWNFGDGSSGSGRSVSHTYTAGSAYDARLTVTDNRGASSSSTVRITATASAILRSTNISLSAKRNGSTVGVTGQVTIRDGSGVAAANATVSASWLKPDGTAVIQTAVTNNQGVVAFSTSGGRGTYTVTVTNISKTGYTFDAASSLLSKSITK